jgi:ribonuclease-3
VKRREAEQAARTARLDQLAERLGHRFGRPALLDQALIPPSHRNERRETVADNQRLEFLGDAAIELAVSEHLYAALPGANEGALTMLRARVVCAPTLAEAARGLALGGALRLGRGERATGGADRDSLLSDALEAVIGAVLVDAGFDAARAVTLRVLAGPLDAAVAAARASGGGMPDLLRHTRNWKTALQEHVQRQGAALPQYALVQVDGPDHARRFVVAVEATVDGVERRAEGGGPSKKAAEVEAARALWEGLGGAPLAPGTAAGAADGADATEDPAP